MRKMVKSEEAVYLAVTSGEIEVDTKGRVWRTACRRGNKIIPCQRRRAENRTTPGYLQVRVMYDWKRHHACAHRLVWLHHNGMIPQGLTINHKNGIKDDNRPENLEIATYSENLKHRTTLGVFDQSGEKNHQSKITDVQVAEIRKRRSGGEQLISIAKAFGISYQHVSKISLRQRR